MWNNMCSLLGEVELCWVKGSGEEFIQSNSSFWQLFLHHALILPIIKVHRWSVLICNTNRMCLFSRQLFNISLHCFLKWKASLITTPYNLRDGPSLKWHLWISAEHWESDRSIVVNGIYYSIDALHFISKLQAREH